MGPLNGYKVVEFGGIGPGPMCATLLADMGATVIRIDRTVPSGLGIPRPSRYDLLNRNRHSIAIDLKKPEAIETALKLIEQADALIEGFRPGTMERLGLGPDVCMKRNPRLAYGRMTGWGQEGPLALTAGHDINYIALTGVLHAIGRKGDKPVPPLNLIGDFGGGAMFLAFGLVCAMLEAKSSDQGQVVDAAMVDGAAFLMTPFYGMHAYDGFKLDRGTNITDTGAYYWEVYECADGRFVSVGPIETRFRELLLKTMGLDKISPALDALSQDEAKKLLEKTFRTKTQAQWCELLEGTDACFAPVLSMADAPNHPHNRVRETFIEIDGVVQPAPAPRFSRTKPGKPTPPENPGQSTKSALREWGFAEDDLKTLERAGVFG
ncbi:CaiB/BaiF CoA-transferase family protein [Bradyrhizobium sp. dw_78]|uniref:CaiB/BaiF CoA transferase family protein n=1 Tax=Bradyrhizobium sp. dw_78 TaxID=2719793 RepID=UPI001BD31FBE|nr:CaiB/BaiF CoA-transferase family protein [Bradyrhizobium sp. dw_78]